MLSTALVRTVTVLLVLLSALCLPARVASEEPICLHPENPRYFRFRDRPAFLITSGEHYGAVLNQDFDYVRYLDELAGRRFNVTRLFSGSYHEVPGSFQIAANTLAPAPGRYLAPWLRSTVPAAADGGNKFELTAWNPAYFERLQNFVAAAGKRGIVVELALFCPFYEDDLWRVNPMNARNNVNDVGAVPRTEVFTLKHPNIVAAHDVLVRKLVTKLHGFDNLYYEICNEPYFGGVALDWQKHIAQVISETEIKLGGPRHMIAQNIANGRAKIESPNPAVSLFNFHYATPPDVIALNSKLNKAFADDETGFRGTGDRVYRTEAWEFLLAGGGVFSNLDYSFTTEHPNGTAAIKSPTPGGGGPSLRSQLTVLRDFLFELNFVHMRPDRSVVKAGVPEKASVQALVEPGRAYAVYLSSGAHADLVLDLRAGRYRVEWLNPRDGSISKSRVIDHKEGRVTLASPQYDEDIALRVIARP
jgi:hypothetical protein